VSKKLPTKTSDDILSVNDMQRWLLQEVRDVTTATRIRLEQATSLVNDYATGKISPQEAADAMVRYTLVWGDALDGVVAVPGKTDEEIATELKTAFDESFASRVQKHSAGSRSVRTRLQDKRDR